MDYATLVAKYLKALHLPPSGRPRWISPTDAQLDLIYLGWGYRWFGRHPIPISRHEGWVYILVQQGAPTLRLEEGCLRLSPGELIIIDPECASGWEDRGRHRSQFLVWMVRSAPRCGELLPPPGKWSRWKLERSVIGQLGRIHAACRHEVENVDSWSKLALEQLRLGLDVFLVRSLRYGKPRPPPATARLGLALQWMREHLSAKNPVSQLCRYLQISPATLNRIFLHHLGESPTIRYQQIRMEVAVELLSGGKMNVKQTAHFLGYFHPNDFSRAFKIFTGRPPTQFGKRLKFKK